jgi:hypothetical protein
MLLDQNLTKWLFSCWNLNGNRLENEKWWSNQILLKTCL